MRFWVKGKQGEKKTPREKLATQSELLELYAEQEAPGREAIPGLQLGEGTWWGDTGPVLRREKLGWEIGMCPCWFMSLDSWMMSTQSNGKQVRGWDP